MGVSSKIEIRTLEGDIEVHNYNCAQPIKTLYTLIDTYKFKTMGTDIKDWKKWIAFLVDMGIPLSIKVSTNSNLDISITDMSFVNSGTHLLWIHSLIRMPSELEQGFVKYIEYVYALRDVKKLKKYDNYQIMQLALMFENKVTCAPSSHSHLIFATIAANSQLLISLLTFNEAILKIKVSGALLNLTEAASSSADVSEIVLFLGKNYKGTPRSRDLEVSDILGLKLESENCADNINSRLDKILEYFEKIKPLFNSSIVMCTRVKPGSTLIKGNLYRIEDMHRSSKLVTITDAWGHDILTRHFKTIL